MTKQAKPSYEELTAELETIMTQLQRNDIAVDQAISQYERGLELIAELEAYLKTAENKVKKLKAATARA